MTALIFGLACLAVTIFCTLSSRRSSRTALAAAKLAQDAAGDAQHAAVAGRQAQFNTWGITR